VLDVTVPEPHLDVRAEAPRAAREGNPHAAARSVREKSHWIQRLLRGPLRTGVTGLFVADAKSGEPLFAVNAGDPLNPASNVKLISTAAALELLGPEFRYPTRVLGPTPVGGARCAARIRDCGACGLSMT